MYGHLPGGGLPPAAAATGGMLATTGFPIAGALLASAGILLTGILMLRTKYVLGRSDTA